MSRWRSVAKTAAIALPTTVGLAGAAFRWRNRPQMPIEYNMQSLEGRTVVVTGGTSGIGQSTVKGLLGLGAHVIVGVRNSDRGQSLCSAMATVKSTHGSEIGHAATGKLDVLPLDLCDPRSILAFTHEAKKMSTAEGCCLHAVINAAAEICCTSERTAGGVDVTFFTNHVGPQFLLSSLLPEMLSKSEGNGNRHKKIILVGSRLERRGQVDLNSLQDKGIADPRMVDRFDPMTNYAASKLANMLLATEVRRRLNETDNIDVAVVSPGMVNTGLWRNFPAWYRTITYPMRAAFLRSPEEGALGILYAVAASQAEGLQDYTCDGCPLECSDAAKNALDAEKLFEVCEALLTNEQLAQTKPIVS